VTPDPKDKLSQAAGVALLALATDLIKKGDLDEAETYVKEIQRYGLPDEVLAWDWITWGNILGMKAQATGDLALYDQAFDKHDKATQIKPDMHEAWNNWGIDLGRKAQATVDPALRDALYDQAFEKYSKATQIKSDLHEAWYNWGNDLGRKAQATVDPALRDALYDQAFDKFAKAVEIKQDKHEAWNNWGASLGMKAQATGDLALYNQALENYAKATQIKPDYHVAWFNQAGTYSLLNDNDKCLASLEKWRTYHPNPTRVKLDDDNDFDNIRNTPEFVAFRETLPG
jgi:tetratricopeptide (TPR) repeat protein